MTRHSLLASATAVLLVAGACSQPDAPAARATPAGTMPTPAPPVVVHVQVPEGVGPEVEAWAEELRAAVKAGHGDLTLAASAEEAAVVVRIDSVDTGVKTDPEPEGEGETSLMQGALIVDGTPREFRLAYRGEVRPQAEALARNLSGYATEAAEGEADATEPEGEPDTAEPGPNADTGE